MAGTFGKNKSRIQAILEKNISILVPKLFSLELISNVDRDVALNTTIDSSTRAASLFDAIEKKIPSYQDLLLFVHILLSSRIDATDRAFIESLPYTSEDDGSSIVRRNSFSGASSCLPLQTHHRQASDPTAVTLKTAGVESVPVSPLLARSFSPEPDDQTVALTCVLSAHDTVIRQSGAVMQRSTDSEYDTLRRRWFADPNDGDLFVNRGGSVVAVAQGSVRTYSTELDTHRAQQAHPDSWDRPLAHPHPQSARSYYQRLHHAVSQGPRELSSPLRVILSYGIRQDSGGPPRLPIVPSTPLQLLSKSDEERIEFSTYKSSSYVGHEGVTLKGEGIQLKIPCNAIKRSNHAHICLQACTSGPFSPPDGVELVSPVFLVSCTPQRIFDREVTLTMEHFVHLQSYEQCDDMVLLTSSEAQLYSDCHDDWQLEVANQRPICSPYTTYGEVELTHFSFFCFGIRTRRVLPEVLYKVSVYSPQWFIQPLCTTIYCISLLHEVYTENLRKCIEKEYPNHNFRSTSEVISSTSLSHEIKLLLPAEAKVLESGYVVVSDKCKIPKSIVDLPTQSRRLKKRARRDKEVYPPRIALTVYYVGSGDLSCQSTDKLHVAVEGIAEDRSICKGFNLPTNLPPTLNQIITTRSIDYESVNTTLLDESDLGVVMSELYSLTVKYYELGRELGVPAHELEILRTTYGANNLEQALNDVVLKWLRGRSPRTWRALVEAVDSPAGGNNHALAVTIAHRHRAVHE